MNTKRCRTCKIIKPISAFEYPRHRMCRDCQPATQALANLSPVGITSTWEGRKKYMRERYRLAATAKEAVKISHYREHPETQRPCARCKQWKPGREFAGPRWRLCRVCDNAAQLPKGLLDRMMSKVQNPTGENE